MKVSCYHGEGVRNIAVIIMNPFPMGNFPSWTLQLIDYTTPGILYAAWGHTVSYTYFINLKLHLTDLEAHHSLSP